MAGLAQPTFYAHFKSVDACVLASAQYVQEKLQERHDYERTNTPTDKAPSRGATEDFVARWLEASMTTGPMIGMRGRGSAVVSGAPDSSSLISVVLLMVAPVTSSPMTWPHCAISVPGSKSVLNALGLIMSPHRRETPQAVSTITNSQKVIANQR